jgi:PAS domain S-box-containing protein
MRKSVNKDKMLLPEIASAFIDSRKRYAEETRVLGIINRFTELLPQKPKVDEVCRHLVRITIEETDFENCSVALWDMEQGFLSLVAAYGMDDMLEEAKGFPYQRNLRFSSRSEIALQAFSTKRAFFIEDTQREPIPTKPDAVVKPGALICLPLMDLGVMNMSRTKPRVISDLERHNWLLISNIVGHVLLNAFLQQHLSDNNERLQCDVDQKTKALELQSQQLMAANSLLELIIDDAPQGICLLDSRAKITRVNKTLEQLQGDHARDLLGRRPAILFGEPDAFEKMLQRVSTSGVERLNDTAMVRTGGERYPANVFLKRLQDDFGSILGHLLIIEDITEAKAISDRLMRAEKLSALGTMAGGVAHDFNNLLTTIMGNTQLLLHQNPAEEICQRLQNIEMAVRDGAHTLRRLQSFTHLDKDHLSPPVVVNVSDIIEDAVELTRPRWKNSMEKHGSSIEFIRDFQPDAYAVIHESDLREVLTNLLFNAIDAMPEGGMLTLRSRRHHGRVLIEVIDTGIGMDSEVQRKIFDPFYTTKGMANSGLGLSVSYSLLNRYDGEITVYSEVGKGSRFQIQLPAAESDRIEASTETISLTTPRKLLVVDDEEEVLNLVRDMFEMAGHQVTAVQDGERAIELLEQAEFDMVFTDLGMPGINGWGVAKKAKEVHPGVPVVLITGWGAQYDGQNLKSQGIDLVLPKPVSYKQLVAAIEQCCNAMTTQH